MLSHWVNVFLSLTDDCVLFCLFLWENSYLLCICTVRTVDSSFSTHKKCKYALMVFFIFMFGKWIARQELIFALVCSAVSCAECPPSLPFPGLCRAHPGSAVSGYKMNQATPDFSDRPSVQTTASSDSGQIKGNASSGKTLSVMLLLV